MKQVDQETGLNVQTNCWEHRGCGREIGGAHAQRLGVCPAARETRLEGINRGTNGGRSCWAVAGTFCGPSEGQKQVAERGSVGCEHCEFYHQVQVDEGHCFVGSALVVALIR